MEIQKSNFLSIEQVQDRFLTQQKPGNVTGKVETSFKDILQQKTESVTGKEKTELKFSKHAANRLVDRNISLSAEQLERLSDGAKKAGEKGIRESLVLMDSLAFIVNIPNSTVITALDQSETADNVFTNIDGAVII